MASESRPATHGAAGYGPGTRPSEARWRRILRRRGPWLLLTVTMLLVTGILTVLEPFPRIDRMLQDNARAAMGQRVTGDVVIVAIDDASLEAIGRWPWQRALHAGLVRQIAAQSPRCIGLDLLLTEQDGAAPSDDRVLANAMQDSGCVVLPMALRSSDVRPPGELVPAPALAAAAAGIGHAHLSLDQDGVVRSIYMTEGFEGRPWPHFARALYEAGKAGAGDGGFPAHPALPAPTSVHGPWLRAARELIVFAHETMPFTTVSYIDVLRGNVPPDVFRDRYVLVGLNTLGMGDVYATTAPSETRLTPGVQIFANVLQGLINEHRVVEATLWQNLAFNLLPLLVALLGLLWLRPVGALLLIVAMLGTRLGLHTLRPWVGVQFAPAAGFMALLLVYPTWSLLRLTATLHFLRVGTDQLNADLEGFPAPRPRKAHGDFLDRQITATARAAMRMRDLHRFVRDGLNQLPDATMVLDRSGTVIFANLAALKFWKDEPTGLAGRDAHELLAGVKLRGSASPMLPPGALSGSDRPIIDEGEDSQGHILLVRCVPFLDVTNSHVGWLISLVDITRMRVAQSQRDEALHFISHDIREPNASILAILELARSRPEQFAPHEIFARIERHAQTGLELADGFVSLARAEAEPFRPEPLDLVALLHEATDQAWAVARKAKVRVVILPGPEEALCQGDRALITRALANVLSNALKFSPPGRDVTCAILERPRHWALSIRDHGPGIAAELQQQLFRAFRRLHRDSHPDVPGVGLGLLLVRAAMQRHDGAVEIDSAADAGCTVTLVLPRPREAELSAMLAAVERASP